MMWMVESYLGTNHGTLEWPFVGATNKVSSQSLGEVGYTKGFDFGDTKELIESLDVR